VHIGLLSKSAEGSVQAALEEDGRQAGGSKADAGDIHPAGH
jgi:hypothetical protein